MLYSISATSNPTADIIAVSVASTENAREIVAATVADASAADVARRTSEISSS